MLVMLLVEVCFLKIFHLSVISVVHCMLIVADLSGLTLQHSGVFILISHTFLYCLYVEESSLLKSLKMPFFTMSDTSLFY